MPHPYGIERQAGRFFTIERLLGLRQASAPATVIVIESNRGIMNRNTGLMAAMVALVAYLGVSNFSKPAGNAPRPEQKQAAAETGSKNAAPTEVYWACRQIADRLHRFTDEAGGAPAESWKFPGSCYQDQQSPASARKLKALPSVGFAIATVPNPVSTHLPLLFDRMVESIQQAAQDDSYSYDASWFPWDTDAGGYSSFSDQQQAQLETRIKQKQPGVIAFRSRAALAYDSGLVVFIVGEQPTGGINDDQLENAIQWITTVDGFGSKPVLRILGPTFSGSVPSLIRVLQRTLRQPNLGSMQIAMSSGTVSSPANFHRLNNWVTSLNNGSYFETAMENDGLIVDRFCRYLQEQGYRPDRIALLSEDETAFGGSDEKVCEQAIRLYYPRDIATLRSAYETQSILNPPKGQTDSSAPSTTLRGDLSEPSGEHDTMRRFGGQLIPLAQESVLLDITGRLRDKQIQFVILRSTNSLDQIFLSEFLHRANPGARVVIDGADLLFSRGAEGKSLRGVLTLSTYPLFGEEQDWTASLLRGRNAGYRSFGEDASEAEYIAARGLFGDSNSAVPLHDYSPPRWALSSNPPDVLKLKPPTWLSVVGHRRFWPLAVLTAGDSQSILLSSSDRGDQPAHNDGDARPVHLPVSMWMALIACVLWSLVHAYFCWSGCIMGSPRARTYFAPLPRPQHPALIALGSLVVAMVPVTAAATSGLFSFHSAERPRMDILMTLLLSLCLAVCVIGCLRNLNLEPLTVSGEQASKYQRWPKVVGPVALYLLVSFIGLHFYLASGLTPANAIPAFLRSVNLGSGVSPLLPQLLLLAGAYLWFWCNLRGLAHFGDDRPLLPKKTKLPSFLAMFSMEKAGDPVEKVTLPVNRGYLTRLLVIFAFVLLVCVVALEGASVRTLGERAFGRLFFFWVCIYVAVILTDGLEMWLAWSRHRELLIYLDRLPLRRTLRALKGLSWGSVWKMSGNVLHERYKVISLQLESLRHLTNAVREWTPEPSSQDVVSKEEISQQLAECSASAMDFAAWYTQIQAEAPRSLKILRDFQKELAATAGAVMGLILIPAWRNETQSLIFDRSKDNDKSDQDTSPDIPLHVRTAEEFVVLPYLAFIQNTLGRIRTMALGSLWLFLAMTLAMSSYPFEPLDVLSGIFLAVFVIFGGLSAVIYAQMARDTTLSHITNTKPGELGWEFWARMVTFGAGPLLGLLTTLFPSITDFVVSWLQPSTQALK